MSAMTVTISGQSVPVPPRRRCAAGRLEIHRGEPVGPRGGIDECIRSLLEKLGMERPPVDAFHVARALGAAVVADDGQRTRGRIVRRKNVAAICLRDEPRCERRHWTVAHEIGEHLMADLADAAGLDLTASPADARESLANRFAMLLLVPPHWFSFDAPMAGFDLFELKSLYRTASHEVLALRLLDLDPPTVISIFDNGRLTRRLSNTRSTFPPLHELEWRCRSQASTTGRPCRQRAAGLDVQAWPIHEPGWKREILRTVCEDECANEVA